MNTTLTLPNGKTIEVANEDYSFEKIHKGEHHKLIKKDGWRLPSIYELDVIFKKMHQAGKGNFRNANALASGSISCSISEAYVRLVRNHPAD